VLWVAGIGKGEAVNGSPGTGKRKGLQAVSDPRGVVAAVAIDQRSALRNLFAGCMGVEPEAVPGDKLAQFKEAVSRILTPHASAILLDPEYGLAAARQRAKNAGLLLAYEKTGYDKKIPGRLPNLLELWSVQRLAEAGADCVKVLLYYCKSSSGEIKNAKFAFVERVGAECAAADIPFFLELVAYSEQAEAKTAEFAKIKPAIISAGVAEFSRPRYRVDVLKVGFPVDVTFVEGSPAAKAKSVYTRQQASEHFQQMASAAALPFLYLSEGVSNEAFQFGLELATEARAGFSGVLCGRATWKNGVPIMVEEGIGALQEWLAREGVRNVQNINRRLVGTTSVFKSRAVAGE
jgi:tagatose 1,6-diphosphate aldolase